MCRDTAVVHVKILKMSILLCAIYLVLFRTVTLDCASDWLKPYACSN